MSKQLKTVPAPQLNSSVQGPALRAAGCESREGLHSAGAELAPTAEDLEEGVAVDVPSSVPSESAEGVGGPSSSSGEEDEAGGGASDNNDESRSGGGDQGDEQAHDLDQSGDSASASDGGNARGSDGSGDDGSEDDAEGAADASEPVVVTSVTCNAALGDSGESEDASSQSSGREGASGSESSAADDGSSEEDVEVVKVVASTDIGVVTRTQARNLRETGTRRSPAPAVAKKQPKPSATSVPAEFYRIVDREKTRWGVHYRELWKGRSETWQSKEGLVANDHLMHLEVVDSWIAYKEVTETANKSKPASQREEVMEFKNFFKSDIGGLRLMDANERYDCSFRAIRHIFEKGFGWTECFTDEDVDAFRENEGITERGVMWEEILTFMDWFLSLMNKKKRESVDLNLFTTNLFRGKGTKLEGLINLDLVDGWYFCGAIDSTRQGHAFPLRVQGGLWQVFEDDGAVRGLGTQEWIFRMTYVRRVLKVDMSDVRKPDSGAVKKRHRRAKTTAKKVTKTSKETCA